MTDSLTPFEPRRQHSLGTPSDNVPRGLAAGRAASQGQPLDDQGAIPWARYASAIKRSWWVILLVVAAGTAAGLQLARMQPVMYVAESKVMINPSAAAQNSPIGTRQLLPSNQWAVLLRSFRVVDSLVLDLGLHVSFRDAPELRAHFALEQEFTPGDYQLVVDSLGQAYTLTHLRDGEAERGAVGDSIGARWGFAWSPPASLLPPGRTVEFTVQPIRDASKGLLGRITAQMPSENAQFMLLTFRDWSPERAARILNAWTDRFVRTASEIKSSSLVQAQDIVGAQLSTAQEELFRAESQQRAFRERSAGLPGYNADGGATGTVLQQRLEIDELQRDRVKLERLLAGAGSGPIPPEQFYSVPEVLNTTPQLKNALLELEQLQASRRSKISYLTEAHPEVDSLNREIRRLEYETIPRHTRNVIASYQLREQEMRSRVDAQTDQLRAIPARAMTEAQLARQVSSFETLYQTLKRKSEELRLADAETTPDLERLDAAEVPLRPERNEAARLLLMAVVASLGAGIALALLRDRIDRRFRYPEQATMDLGLTIAGTVPRLRFNRKKELGVTALSQVVESFRAMRLTVRHQFPAGEPMVLCVSSPGAEEGKSLVSSNLAVAFANAGHSTLLIDGDVRRGVVHTTFDAPRRPGLVDHLAGKASADTIIRPTSTPNLSIIASGIRSKDAPELLVSDAMASLVSAMRERFEVVIIDSAPFSAGMDAFALGAAAGTMLVVLRPGVTDRKLAAMKLEVLDRLPVAVVGAVLNGIAHSSAYKYYYADYGYSDSRQWALDDDADEPNAALAGTSGGQRLLGPKK